MTDPREIPAPAEGFTRMAPQTGTGFLLRAGQVLTVVDPTGVQVSDFFAFSAEDDGEWLSSGRTIDYGNKVYFTTFDLLYPEFEGAYHPSCFENLCLGLQQFGIEPDQVSTTLNIFMNVWTDETGELHIDPPTSRAGDRFVLRAEMDLHVGLTACSAEKSNGGVCKPIDYAISD